MTAHRVTIYTTAPCAFCSRAKQLLARRGVPFQEIFLSYADENGWNDLARRSGMMTMPQIFDGERLIGGYQELAELDTADHLASLKS